MASFGYLAGFAALAAAAALVLNNLTVRVPLSCRLLVAGLVTIGMGLLVPLALHAGRGWEPHPVRLVGDALVLLALCCFVGMLTYTLDGERATRRRAKLRGGLLAGVVLLMTAVVVVAWRLGGFAGEIAGMGEWAGILVYQLAFLAYVTIGASTIMVLSARYITRAKPVQGAGLVRSGMALVWGAGGCFLGAAAWDLLGLVRAGAAHSPASVREALFGSAVVLLVTGMTMPSWGTYVRLRWRRWRAAKLVTELTPLWQTLAEVLPQVRLHEAPAEVEVLLYRRVIEIRDAEVVLRPYLPEEFDDFAMARVRELGLPSRQHTTIAQAAGLTLAMAAYRARVPAGITAEWLRPECATVDTVKDAQVLVALARAMTHPAVQQIGMEFPKARDRRRMSAAG